MNYKKFFQNAALLTATGLVLRAAGLLMRVLLANALGEEGMGLYSLTFTVYNLFITIAQSGIATAVTRLVAHYLALKQPAAAKGALRACIFWSGALGMFSGAALFLGSGFLADRWIGDPSCAFALRMLSFSLPLMAVTACYAGYFLSLREARPSCIAQLLEQGVRLGVVGIALAVFRGAEFGTLLGAVVLANTISEGVSCLFIYGQSRRTLAFGRAEKPPKGSIRRIALPIAASRYLSTALHTTENMLIPLAIAKYTGDYSLGLAQFGALKGMAIPLLFFPASFLNALSTLLVPEVTDTSARADWRGTRRIVCRALGITCSLSVMIGGVFFLYGEALGNLLFHSQTAGWMLKVLAPITPFMYMDTIADGLLKGLDRQGMALRNNTIDSVLRILLIAVAVPLWGIQGFLAVMVWSNIFICALNMGTLLKACCLSMQWRDWVFRPLIACGIAYAVWVWIPLKEGFLPMAVGCVLWCGCYLLVDTWGEKGYNFYNKGCENHEEKIAGSLRRNPHRRGGKKRRRAGALLKE